MPAKLLIATHNPDKLSEIRQILGDLPVELVSLDDYPEIPPTVEDRDTIEGNAMKKALEASKATGHLCLADDTGLFIKALDNAPGVFAARFAGEDCSYRDNRLKALKLMEGKTDRSAEFRTAVALSAPDGIISLQLGVVKGSISTQEIGDKGFGYDAVFIVESLNRTYAELSDNEKNEISHRALALKAMLPILKRLTD